MTTHPEPPPALDALDDDPLTRLVAHFIAVGEQALADDKNHGRHWGRYADWAWRTGTTALGSTSADVVAWLDTDAEALPAVEVDAVLDAIRRVHVEAGYADPTTEVER